MQTVRIVFILIIFVYAPTSIIVTNVVLLAVRIIRTEFAEVHAFVLLMIELVAERTLAVGLARYIERIRIKIVLLIVLV